MTDEQANSDFQKFPIFKLIEKLYQKQPLTFKEKLHIYNNWPCLFFGIFYYMYHKMFKKAVIYIPIGFIVATIMLGIDHSVREKMNVNSTQLVFLGINIVCFFRANIDLYKTKILKNAGFW